MRNATSPCLDSFCRLDRLGLTVTAQIIEPDHSVLVCSPTTPATPCPDCAGAGTRHDTVIRKLAHVPFGWKPTILQVNVPRYRCADCARVWRHELLAAILGVAWNTCSDAILASADELLFHDPARLDGVTAIGVDEHVVRHEALLYRMEVGDLHWLAVVAAK